MTQPSTSGNPVSTSPFDFLAITAACHQLRTHAREQLMAHTPAHDRNNWQGDQAAEAHYQQTVKAADDLEELLAALIADPQPAGSIVRAFREYLAVHDEITLGGNTLDDMALDLARICLSFHPGYSSAWTSQAEQRIGVLVSQLIALRPSLSYSKSYCGEPEGLVKSDVADWERQGAKPLPLRPQQRQQKG